MRMVSPRIGLGIGVAMAATIMATMARAGDIEIKVTNDQPSGGFALAPVWFGVQDGSFTTFTPGGAASSQVATLAQTGNTAPLSTLFESQHVGIDTTLKSGGSLAQFLPGRSNSTILAVSNPAIYQYLSYAGMFVPSNDFFLGNATPLQIFNSDGSFKGPITINIYGSDIWDSGSEQQSLTTALTFIQGQMPATGVQTSDPVTSLFGESTATTFLQGIDGKTTAAGYVISHIPTSSDLIATIQISSVPEPASIAMLGTGLLGALFAARTSRSRRRPLHR